jgi:hypothetical protein
VKATDQSTYASFILPSLDEGLTKPIGLDLQSLYDNLHLALPVVFVDDVLMLVDDQCYTL